MTVEGLVEAWKERAKLEVQRALLIQSVYSQEKMQIGNNELNQELAAMAQEYGVEPVEMVQTLQQNNALDELQFRALSRKVSDFLLAHADVTIGTPKASEKLPEAVASEDEQAVEVALSGEETAAGEEALAANPRSRARRRPTRRPPSKAGP